MNVRMNYTRSLVLASTESSHSSASSSQCSFLTSETYQMVQDLDREEREEATTTTTTAAADVVAAAAAAAAAAKSEAEDSKNSSIIWHGKRPGNDVTPSSRPWFYKKYSNKISRSSSMSSDGDGQETDFGTKMKGTGSHKGGGWGDLEVEVKKFVEQHKKETSGDGCMDAALTSLETAADDDDKPQEVTADAPENVLEMEPKMEEEAFPSDFDLEPEELPVEAVNPELYQDVIRDNEIPVYTSQKVITLCPSEDTADDLNMTSQRNNIIVLTSREAKRLRELAKHKKIYKSGS